MSRLIVALVLVPSLGYADDIAGRLALYDNEARTLGANLPAPNAPAATDTHRLVDAEVAYSLGDFDGAAQTLFDLVRPGGATAGPDNEAATYYLADALFQKGDRGAARTYFENLVKTINVSSHYYQPSLERLVELAIVQHDLPAAHDSIAALGQLAPGVRDPSVPYTLGKYAYAEDKYDDALALFDQVPKGSDYELQALYYTGTIAVAKKDLAHATEIFTDLIGRKPRTGNDRRVIELGQLALGRLYYEREQPSKSIDSYLLVDRHSDLFPDALYEVAWVYVKSKQYDKALRALELLELSEPNTTKTPTTRILEGNLRIRKAQMIRAAEVNGTINTNEQSDPGTEYDKAAKIFTETHDQYMPSYAALTQMVDGGLDPASFVDQIAERQSHVFQNVAPIPEAAAQWLRDEPAVQRFVSVEADLADTQANLASAQAMLDRLDLVIAAPDHSTVYPALASRRERIATIQNDLANIRNDLADQELRNIDSSGELAQLTANRKQLAAQYAAFGNPEQAFAARVTASQDGFDKIDQDATEVETYIDSAQAMAVALRKYANEATPALPADQKASLQQQLDDAAREAQAIEDEIADVRRNVVLGKDLAAIGDTTLAQARDVRRQLRAAQDAEQHALDGFVASSRDRKKSEQLARLADQAWRIAAALDTTDQSIAQVVEAGIAQARTEVADLRVTLAQYKKELADDDAEGRALGGSLLAASFKDVKAKFYDVIVRTDVGNVDVAWSEKEDTDDDLKRLNLARARELKQLHDEFRDILEETAPPPTPHKQITTLPPPSPEGPATSPDKGGAKPGDRIKPVGDDDKGTTAPTVKPDESKTPKKGGSR
ncbi:MAG TPA: tetratricopeptide repeat protein [Kofleriaceae bacterium]|nr:tetratricopeptide repeat protein [Kofleriaceae bacterium]